MNTNDHHTNARRTSAGKQELLKACLYVFCGVIAAFIIFWLSDMGKKKIPPPVATVQNEQSTSTTAIFDWKKEIRKIEKSIGEEFADIKTRERSDISLYKLADITGDGIEEAVISLGTGGASTEYFALMKYNDTDDIPQYATFKLKDDSEENYMLLLEGDSVAHGSSFELIPSKNAIYIENWGLDTANTDTIICELDAYQWNKDSSMFEYNKGLSDIELKTYCAELGN